MKQKSTLSLSLVLAALSMLSYRPLSAQTAGDFRSVVSVSTNWSDNLTWERFDGTTWVAAAPGVFPSSTDGVVTIKAGTTVTSDNAQSASHLEVEAGATLQLLFVDGTKQPLTISDDGTAADDLVVDGTLILRGFRGLAGVGFASAAINGNMTWLVGYLDIPTTIVSGGTLDLTIDDFNKTLETQLTVNGVMNWNSSGPGGNGDIVFDNGTLTINGTLNEQLSTDHGFDNAGIGTNAFINNGVFNKTTMAIVSVFGTGTNAFQFTNTNTINGIGTLDLTPTTPIGGLSIVASSGLLGGGTISGSTIGTLNITSNLIDNTPATIASFVKTGGVAGVNYNVLNVIDGAPIDLTNAALQVSDLPPGTTDPIGTVYTVFNAPGTITGNDFLTGGASLSPSMAGSQMMNAHTVTVTKLTILPLNWGDFTALAGNNDVQLAWTTLQEQNTSYFSVEYSTDGKGYSSIGTVAAAGNSSLASHYHYTHSSPQLNGNNFYRLKEFDLDGKPYYSPVRVVRFNNGNIVKVIAGPNPTHDALQLSVQEEGISVVLTDASGKALRTLVLKPGVTQTSMSSFPVGTYQLVIYQKQQRIATQQIIKY